MNEASHRGVADGSMHAWIDESIHAPSSQVPHGMYIVAAAIARPRSCDQARAELRKLVPKGGGRLHWRNESDPLRRKIAAVIATLDCANVVVVGSQLDPRKQERARSKCLERLFYELALRDVSRAWIESRTPELNDRDRTLVARLRSRGAMPTGLFVDFEVPSAEPMLWVPDAVAGSVGMARKSIALDIRASMGAMITEIDLAIDL